MEHHSQQQVFVGDAGQRGRQQSHPTQGAHQGPVHFSQGGSW